LIYQPASSIENINNTNNAAVEDKSVEESPPASEVEVEAFNTFDEMGLKEDLLRGIYSYGFEKPSAIQQRAIVPLSSGVDVIAQAQSGTGKTGAFSIGALQRIDINRREPQVMIMSPTRELARQSHTVISSIGDYLGVRSCLVIGGANFRETIQQIKDGVHVVVATPGRCLDMIERRQLSTRSLKLFILDEADEMLSQGFEEQVHGIVSKLPEECQIGLFSATMPEGCVALAESFMKKPVSILVKAEEVTLEGIKQFYIDCQRDDWKLDTLCDLYTCLTVSQTVIFLSSRRKVEWLQAALEARDFTVSAIHGEMDDKDRAMVMQEFRSGSSRILLATDLLARGIDVQQVSLVVNYDMPREQESYIHRIGRGGRFGRKGVAINLVTADDARMVRQIEQFYSTQIEEMPADVAVHL